MEDGDDCEIEYEYMELKNAIYEDEMEVSNKNPRLGGGDKEKEKQSNEPPPPAATSDGAAGGGTIFWEIVG